MNRVDGLALSGISPDDMSPEEQKKFYKKAEKQAAANDSMQIDGKAAAGAMQGAGQAAASGQGAAGMGGQALLGYGAATGSPYVAAAGLGLSVLGARKQREREAKEAEVKAKIDQQLRLAQALGKLGSGVGSIG